jgi:pyruvate carboxylase
LEFGANEVGAAIAFFQSRGFENEAALITAQVLLNQAKLDDVPVFKIIDTLKNFNGVQISALVAEILNNNRNATSSLGYRTDLIEKQNQTRNIFA